jgi:phosphoketolase
MTLDEPHTAAAEEPETFAGGADELRLIDAYWRAANYISVGQIYLYDNPLLRRPLTLADVKPMVVGHWGTTPGQNFIYVHLNRVIRTFDLDMIYVAGPGHGGPAIVGNVWLEGSWSEIYPDVGRDEAGMKALFKQFSFPGGISSHVAPTTPGSIHEGGELGYSLSHAFGAVFDNPGLIVACVVGDGEAETGPLATSWQSNKLLSPTARCCRSCTSTATRSAIRHCSRGFPMTSLRRSCAAAAGSRTSSRATIRRRCMHAWPRCSIERSLRSVQSSIRRAAAVPRSARHGR